MAWIHRGQWPFFLIPALVILVLLPVAVVIGFNTGEDNDSVDPEDPAVRERSEQEGETQPLEGEVLMANFEFRPANVEVGVGDTVTFRNTTDTEHQVVFSSGGDSSTSDSLSKDDTYEWTAEEVGTFEYYCGIHPNDMAGTVEVTESSQ